MLSIDIQSAATWARIVCGNIQPTATTLFAPMRNELHFLPAWLGHHRKLGFQQFLIWDDASDDGTFEYLQACQDCVVVKSDFRFGDRVRYTDPNGKKSIRRIGTVFKSALPHVLLKDTYVGYLDADEFLILPPDVTSVDMVIERLKEEQSSGAMASVIEFFPRTISDLQYTMPDSFEGLIEAYPFIQAEKLIDLTAGQTKPDFCNPSKTMKLFQNHGISFPAALNNWQKMVHLLTGRKPKNEQGSPRYKTPLIFRGQCSFQVGSHKASIPPSTSIMLTIAHFVFNEQSYKKALRATKERSHRQNSQKYNGYIRLFENMHTASGNFLDEKSVRYEGPQQLLNLDLMRW